MTVADLTDIAASSTPSISAGTSLTIDSATVHIGNVRIVSDVCARVAAGSFVGILGPNGSGKSTLLRAASRLLRPTTGAALIGSDDVWSLTARATAQLIAVVSQESHSDFEFTAREVIELGRLPHHRLFDRGATRDTEVIDRSISATGLGALADRSFVTLSGGEKQKVLLARALAQEPQLLLLDEPTNHLDISSQIELLGLVRSLPLTVVAALHDLNLAAAFCDEVVVMSHGRVVAAGPTNEVLTADTIAAVYGVQAHCSTHPLTGRSLIAFGELIPPNPITRP